MGERTLGFIGLGVMGEPICRNLRERSGKSVIAYDLNPEPLQRLAQNGVDIGSSAADVARNCDTLFLSLPSGKELTALALDDDGILGHTRTGQIVVDLGTSPLSLTRQLSSAFSERGAGYLDAPVARTRQAAEDGTLAVMVGGNAELLEIVRPFIACFASDVTYCGNSGSGQVTKILNNMVLFQTVTALSEAYAIARSVDVDTGVLFDALSKGSADSFALRNHGMKSILPRQFPSRAFSVDYARKDLQYALEMASAGSLDAGGASNVLAQFDKAIAAGQGDAYFPVVSRILNQELA